MLLYERVRSSATSCFNWLSIHCNRQLMWSAGYVKFLVTSDKGGGTCFCPCLFVCLFVCLSVCLLARLLISRAWISMKCCVSTDIGTSTNWWTFEPDPDYRPDDGTGLLSPISYMRCYAEFYVGKSRRATTASRGFKMVLFTQPSEHLCRR